MHQLGLRPHFPLIPSLDEHDFSCIADYDTRCIWLQLRAACEHLIEAEQERKIHKGKPIRACRCSGGHRPSPIEIRKIILASGHLKKSQGLRPQSTPPLGRSALFVLTQ